MSSVEAVQLAETVVPIARAVSPPGTDGAVPSGCTTSQRDATRASVSWAG